MAGFGADGIEARGALLAAAVLSVASAAFAERLPYSRYESIVDRQMFGPLPAGFDRTKSPKQVAKTSSAAEKELAKEQEKVKSAIRFSVINVTPEGETAIGFTDNSDPKKPVHYYLRVGESKGGWEVKEADAKAATMTIAKDGVEVSLSLGGDSAKGAGKTEAVASQNQAAPPLRSGLLGAGGSLASRRRARLEQEEADRQKRLAEDRAREEERERREEERLKRAEEERAKQEAERQEMQKNLQAIADELKKQREANAASENGGGNDG